MTELSALLAETVNPHPAVIELANSSPLLLEYNEGALMDEKVQVRNMDAFTFLEDTDQWFDVIFVDLPDPNNESLNKLHTKEFYSLVRNHLKPGGAAMIQATSPVLQEKFTGRSRRLLHRLDYPLKTCMSMYLALEIGAL